MPSVWSVSATCCRWCGVCTARHTKTHIVHAHTHTHTHTHTHRDAATRSMDNKAQYNGAREGSSEREMTHLQLTESSALTLRVNVIKVTLV